MPPSSLRTHVNELFSPELRVPQHDPNAYYSQPCHPLTINAIHSSPTNKTPSTRVPASQVVPVDSVQSSLHRDESQILAPQVPTSPSIALRQSLDVPTELINQQDVGSARVEVRENEAQLSACRATNERHTRRDATDDAIESHTEEGRSSDQPVPYEDTIVASRPSLREGPNIVRQRTEQPPASIKLPASKPSIQPDPHLPSREPQQAYSKLSFWKRYRLLRKMHIAGENTSTAVSQHPNASVSRPERRLSLNRTSETRNQVANTTDTIEFSASAETFSTHAVSVAIGSPHLYRLNDGTYVGKLKDLPPPATLEANWARTTRTRLVTDLRPVLASLPKALSRDETVIELELCMSGRVNSASNMVQLRPAIWIRCGSSRCRDSIRAAAADLLYIRVFQVHFQLNAPRFACLVRIRPISHSRAPAQPPPIVHPRPIRTVPTRQAIARQALVRPEKKNPADFFLNPDQDPSRPEIQQASPQMAELSWAPGFTQWPTYEQFSPGVQDLDPRHSSACGLRIEFEVSDGHATTVAASIIGGLVRCNGALYALTTAHAIFELLPAYDRLQSQAETHQYGDMSVLMSILKVKIGKCLTFHEKSELLRAEASPLIDYSRSDSPSTPTLNIRALGYGDRYLWPKSVGWPMPIMDSLHSNPTSSGSDFALIEIGKTAMRFNTYQPLANHSQRSLPQHAIRDVPMDLCSGPVLIILPESEVRSGSLLQSPTMFMDRSGVFETRKVYTDQKLGKCIAIHKEICWLTSSRKRVLRCVGSTRLKPTRHDHSNLRPRPIRAYASDATCL